MNRFIKNACNQILGKHGTLTAARYDVKATDHLGAVNFIEKHSPSNFPLTESRQEDKKICHVCFNNERRKRKRKYVTTWCTECKVSEYKIY